MNEKELAVKLIGEIRRFENKEVNLNTLLNEMRRLYDFHLMMDEERYIDAQQNARESAIGGQNV